MVDRKPTSANPRVSGEYWDMAEEREAKKCVFCDLKEKYVVTSDHQATLTANIFPYIDGQLLIVPKRHIETLDELTIKEVFSIHTLMKQGKQILEDTLDIKNFWIILRDGEKAGKTIRHLHWNIMPYVDRINTWHYQEITLEPIDLAAKLRDYIKK